MCFRVWKTRKRDGFAERLRPPRGCPGRRVLRGRHWASLDIRVQRPLENHSGNLQELLQQCCFLSLQINIVKAEHTQVARKQRVHSLTMVNGWVRCLRSTPAALEARPGRSSPCSSNTGHCRRAAPSFRSPGWVTAPSQAVVHAPPGARSPQPHGFRDRGREGSLDPGDRSAARSGFLSHRGPPRVTTCYRSQR